MKTIKNSRQTGRGVSIAAVSRGELTELFLTLRPDGINEKPPATIARAVRALKKRNAAVVKMDIFGPLKGLNAYVDCLSSAYGGLVWPVTLVGTGPGPGTGIAGIQIYAVSGVPVETVFLDGKPAARVYEDKFAKYCVVGNVLPSKPGAPRRVQALDAFRTLEKALVAAGMAMPDIVRTWFYLDDILSWYGGFNAVRSKFFSERNMTGRSAPASTGVGGENPAHAALVVSALAVKPKARGAEARALPSPLQCPAPDYGSLFSRAVELSAPGGRSLLVSGTASIEAGGRTVHEGDAEAQIAFTMKVVEALLSSRGMAYSDVTRAIAYFRNAADFPAYERYRKRSGSSALRPLIMQSVVCRGDLLFEIEVDAFSRKTRREKKAGHS
ncbi:MAG: RidA family protein [Elusimicrobiota bacterium]|nr:RidA family protein [Elusimicrobiota bacterium]